MSTVNIDLNSESNISKKCVQKDLQSIKKNMQSLPVIFIEPVDENLLHLEAAITGPLLTPYENGIFLLHIKLPSGFPFQPPLSVQFLRPVMHPNVDEWGKIHSNLLKKTSWRPNTTISDILIHAWNILALPDIESNECDQVRAQLYKQNRENFEIQARKYSQKYASAS